jgi:hypothetical protein
MTIITIFLRRRFPVCLIDQPRRGRAARGTQPINIPATPDEQLWFGIFRLGAWPDFYPGVQFSRDPEALNQFFRQMASGMQLEGTRLPEAVLKMTGR